MAFLQISKLLLMSERGGGGGGRGAVGGGRLEDTCKYMHLSMQGRLVSRAPV